MSSAAIYVEKRRFEIAETQSAVRAAYARLESLQVDPPARRNVLVYVHGRALGGFPLLPKWDKEPDKSQREVIPELEARYGSAVLMLHWPHRGTGVGFPHEYARAAATALGALIEAVATSGEGAEPGSRPPFVLLTHSMGSVVLEQLVMNGGVGRLHEFDALLISSPASKAPGSADWLRKLPADKTYVTVNRRDPVLVSGMLGNMSADGLQGQTANNVFYLDTSKEDVGHRYFVFGGKVDEGEARLYERFYRPVFSGLAPDREHFSPMPGGEPIYTLR